jgi:hypothetical protein
VDEEKEREYRKRPDSRLMEDVLAHVCDDRIGAPCPLSTRVLTII